MKNKLFLFITLILVSIVIYFVNCGGGDDSITVSQSGTTTGVSTGTGAGVSTGTAIGVNTPPTFSFTNLNRVLDCSYLSSGFVIGTVFDNEDRINTVEYSLDFETWKVTTGTNYWKIKLPVGTSAVISGTNLWQSNTKHTIELRAFDDSGSCTTSEVITFIKGLNKDFNGDGYADVIIGAYSVNSNTGAAYIYHSSSDGISSSASASATSANTVLTGITAEDYFGCSVASCGDVNGDGYADVIVGADCVNNYTGAAYVYNGSSDGIVSSAGTVLTGVADDDWFGTSVASCGDVNNDGYDDVVVGATGSDVGGTNAGAVYVFHGGSGGVTSIVNTTLTGITEADWFGSSVTGCGDVNGDGYGDLIVGAQIVDGGSTNSGVAYVFHGSSIGISDSDASSAITTLLGSSEGDRFGGSVAGRGDVNDDGYADVIVGAYLSDISTTNAGAAYVFHGSSGGVNASANTTLMGVNEGDCFGVSVAGCGDVNSDGYADVIVGVEYSDIGSPDSGAAYIYHGRSTGISSGANVILTGSSLYDWFGYSVAGCGDVNGDGSADIIVGAYGTDITGTNAGMTYIFHGRTTEVSTTPKSILTGADEEDFFGYSVSMKKNNSTNMIALFLRRNNLVL